MIIMKIALVITVWMWLSLQAILAQEVLLPLHQNPAKSKELLEAAAKDGHRESLSLPIWDDFTGEGPYPDASIWADSYVYINDHLGVHPRTFGVATFDILDQYGQIYEHANLDNIPFVADHLSSHPIDLSGFSPGDSVMLSFYYQPQGWGGDPSTTDSLVVQFFLAEQDDDNGGDNGNGNDNGDGNGEEARWQSVWGAPGKSLQEFSQDTFPYFHRVVIPIEDEQYFREDFRFRFRNWASFSPGQSIPFNSGGGNIWNIDYVYLDQGRSVDDAYYYDIAFAVPAQSMLKHYTSIPWSQYIAKPEEMLRSNFDVRITNLDQSTYSYSYRYVIQNENNNTIRTYSGGSWVIPPFSESGYQQHPQHANPIILANPLPTAPALKRHFHIVHALQEGATGDAYRRNDTISYKQLFSNYFAYDYGTPQRIQLVRGIFPSRAIQFVLNHPDTLEAVKFYFAETINLQDEGEDFELVIWKTLDPPEELYRSDPIRIDGIPRNYYHPIYLDSPIMVEDTLYVGITQLGQNIPNRRSIALGYDMRNNVQERMFFDAGEGWMGSVESGTPMIRLQMQREHITGIGGSQPAEKPALKLYPNPLSCGKLHISLGQGLGDPKLAEMRIFDIQGRLVYRGTYQSEIDISTFPQGVYLLQLLQPGLGLELTSRFIIAR